MDFFLLQLFLDSSAADIVLVTAVYLRTTVETVVALILQLFWRRSTVSPVFSGGILSPSVAVPNQPCGRKAKCSTTPFFISSAFVEEGSVLSARATLNFFSSILWSKLPYDLCVLHQVDIVTTRIANARTNTPKLRIASASHLRHVSTVRTIFSELKIKKRIIVRRSVQSMFSEQTVSQLDEFLDCIHIVFSLLADISSLLFLFRKCCCFLFFSTMRFFFFCLAISYPPAKLLFTFGCYLSLGIT